MGDHGSSEYELVELQEGSSESDEPAKPKPKPQLRPAGADPTKPLRRLWKGESDEDDEPAPTAGKSKDLTAKPAAEGARPTPPARPRTRSDQPPAKAGSEKKVLVEETPAFDTYEARQRGRLLLGLLIPACIGIFGWIFYRLFIYDPFAFEINDEEPPALAAPAAPRRDLDAEARNMFNNARETAKAGRAEEAVKTLSALIKSYPGTKTATEAKEALERPGQNLPLFLDRPTVQAQPATKPEPPAAPPPPQVVEANSSRPQGNASLTLPANPAEPTAVIDANLAMTAGTVNPTRMPTRKLPAGFRATADAGLHESGWPMMIVGDRDGTPLVLVPGGAMTMGNDGGAPNEAPAHRVRLSAFYVDQHEVTLRQFRLFLSESRYRGQPPRSWSEEFRLAASESMPIVMVNGRDAQAYAEWAQKRLPTEAQWEMAARSTDGRLYPWGDNPVGSDRPKSALTRIDPVGTYKRDVSPYGVFDMGGNVLEWTSDWYDSRFYRGLPPGVVGDPTGPAARPRSSELVVKGDRKAGSASARQGINMDKRLNYVGFRCVLPVLEAASNVISNPAPAGPGPQPQPAAQPPAPTPAPDVVPF